MRNKIQRVQVADIAGRVIPTVQKGSDGLAAELKRLAHVSRVIKEGAIGTDHHGADTIPHLTAKETNAIRDYSSNGYKSVNTFLGGYSGFRYRRRPENDLVALVRELERALRKFPSYNDWVVRSFTTNSFAHLSQIVRRYRAGKFVTEPTFLSATPESNWKIGYAHTGFKGSSVHFRWYSKTGKDISHYTRYPDEREILTAPNTRFEVEEIAAIPQRELLSIYCKEGFPELYVKPASLSGVSLWIALKELSAWDAHRSGSPGT